MSGQRLHIGTWARRGLAAVVLFALTVPLFLVCVEALMRAGYIEPKYEFDDYDISLDDRALFKLHFSGNPQINDHGYRDREFSVVKSGKKRALFYGDSFVMGTPETPTIPKYVPTLFKYPPASG